MFNSPLGAESKKQEGIEPSSACFSGNIRVLPVIRLLRTDAGRTARKTPWVPAAPAGRCLRDALRAVIRKSLRYLQDQFLSLSSGLSGVRIVWIYSCSFSRSCCILKNCFVMIRASRCRSFRASSFLYFSLII